MFLIFYITAYAQQGAPPEQPTITLGGALRFNYNLSSWKEGQKERGGDFGYDFFRVNAIAKYKGIKHNNLIKKGSADNDAKPLSS